jgi:Holliday junction resolvase RusA-like endonuclease
VGIVFQIPFCIVDYQGIAWPISAYSLDFNGTYLGIFWRFSSDQRDIFMKFIIPGTPIAKERPRHLCTRERRPYVFDPQKPEMKRISDIIAHQFSLMLENEYGEIDLNPPETVCNKSIDVSLVFIFTPPQSLNSGARNALLWGMGQYNQKPDLDNLEKFYLDCATQARIWHDDAQVACLNSKKIYGEFARTEMTVMAKRDFDIGKIDMKALSVFSPMELYRLADDAKYICSVTLEDMIDVSDLHHSAAALIVFANKYADKLMKVKKIAAKRDHDAAS